LKTKVFYLQSKMSKNLRPAGVTDVIKERTGYVKKELNLSAPRLPPAWKQPKPESGGTKGFTGQPNTMITSERGVQNALISGPA